MTLRSLLEARMKEERYRPSDLAIRLNKSRATVSLTLNKDVGSITVRTLRDYLGAIGLPFDPNKLIELQQ